jgi:exosome complex RNA-binding protein Rrp42 (RNase PH superfamily)
MRKGMHSTIWVNADRMVPSHQAELWVSFRDHLFISSDGTLFTLIALVLGGALLLWIWRS